MRIPAGSARAPSLQSETMNFLLIAGIILVVLAIAAALLKAKSGASEGRVWDFEAGGS